MKIKRNDKVKILTGKDNGKEGKIMQVFTEKGKASVEGLNLSIKHLRARRQGEKGQRIEFPAPIDMSNLLLICPKCGKGTRVAFKNNEEVVGDKKVTKKVRFCKKCGKSID